MTEPRKSRQPGENAPAIWRVVEGQQQALDGQWQALDGLAARLTAIERALSPALTSPRPPDLVMGRGWSGPAQVSQAGTYKITDDPDHLPEAVAAIRRGDWEELARIRQQAAREADQRQAEARARPLWRTRDGAEVRDGQPAEAPAQVSVIHESVPELGAEPVPDFVAARQLGRQPGIWR